MIICLLSREDVQASFISGKQGGKLCLPENILTHNMVNATAAIEIDKTKQLKCGVNRYKSEALPACPTSAASDRRSKQNHKRSQTNPFSLSSILLPFNCPLPSTHWKVSDPQIQVLDLAHALWPRDSWVKPSPLSLLHAVCFLPQWAPSACWGPAQVRC